MVNRYPRLDCNSSRLRYRRGLLGSFSRRGSLLVGSLMKDRFRIQSSHLPGGVIVVVLAITTVTYHRLASSHLTFELVLDC